MNNITIYSEPIDTGHTEGFALGMEASQEKTLLARVVTKSGKLSH